LAPELRHDIQHNDTQLNSKNIIFMLSVVLPGQNRGRAIDS
jgi:hypothetical protein